MWKKLLCKPRVEEGEIASGTLATDAEMSDGPLESLGVSRKSFLIRDLLDAPVDDKIDRGIDQPSPDISQGTSDVDPVGSVDPSELFPATAGGAVSSPTAGEAGSQLLCPWLPGPFGLLFGRVLPTQYNLTATAAAAAAAAAAVVSPVTVPAQPSWTSTQLVTYEGLYVSEENSSMDASKNISGLDSPNDQTESLDLSDPNRLSPSLLRKNRRNRTVFTEVQLMGLERRFDMQKYLSTPDRSELARALGLTQLQVKTWYQNRRMKWKKQVMQGGCPIPPTRPKGRPKKNSIPSRSELDLPPMIIHDLAHIASSSSHFAVAARIPPPGNSASVSMSNGPLTIQAMVATQPNVAGP